MSVLVRAIMDDAAIAVGDPAYSNVKQPEVLAFYNRTARVVARRMRVLEYEAYYDLTAASDLYKLPDDCTQVRRMLVTQTPLVGDSYYPLQEIMEDEHGQLTSRTTAVGDPRRYYVRQGYFHVWPLSSADVVNGGKIIYWGIPQDATDIANDRSPFPDMVRDTLAEGIVVHVLKRMSRLDEAQAREKEWWDSLNLDRDVMEDRSRDRRPNLRTRSRNQDYYDGQV